MRLDDEGNPCLLQLSGHRLPLRHLQHHAEMPHRNLIAIHRAGVVVAGLVGAQMGDDLVAEEIEINPIRRRAPLRATQQIAIKSARFIQGGDREGEMERLHGGRFSH